MKNESAERKRPGIRGSLTMKFFLLITGLLVLVSGITYGCVLKFLPVTYRNELEENLQRVSEELVSGLEKYETAEEAQNLLELFSAGNQADVALLDQNGNFVYRVMTVVEEKAEDAIAVEEQLGAVTYSFAPTVKLGSEAIPGDVSGEALTEDDAVDSAESLTDDTVQEVFTETDGDMHPEETGGRISQIACVDEGSAAEIEDVYATSFEKAWVADAVSDRQSALKRYPVRIGGEEYTLLVSGTMQAVSQAVNMLQEIWPTVLAVILAAALVGAFAASFYLTRPIMAIAGISEKMAKLQFTDQCKEGRRDEIGRLASSLNTLSAKLSAALSDLQTANRQLKSDIEKEREEERRRTAFFAAASHELKTPVTILKGHLGGMLQNIGGYQNREAYLQRSYEVTETMEGMVKEILAISRMESGAWEAKRVQTDLAELLRLQAAELMELIDEKQIEVAADLPEHLWWQADPSMMDKLFRNVLVNAVRYSPAEAQIRLQMQTLQGNVLFSIENTGVHLPEEAIPHLFEAFYRVDGSRNRRSGGSGLGLYIVQMIAAQHGGVCEAENSRDGVRIRVRFTP